MEASFRDLLKYELFVVRLRSWDDLENIAEDIEVFKSAAEVINDEMLLRKFGGSFTNILPLPMSEFFILEFLFSCVLFCSAYFSIGLKF